MPKTLGRVSALSAVAAASAAVLLGGCAAPPAGGDRSVTITRTTYGIPHITARDPESLAYGVAYAYAQDNVCMTADTLVTARGQRSSTFGPKTIGLLGRRYLPNEQIDLFIAAHMDDAMLARQWAATSPQVQASIGTPEEIRQLVDVEFADYYSSSPAGSFAARVWTNNAWAAAQALLFGAALVVPCLVWVLWPNALNVGIAGGLLAANGRLDLFFGLITPHGLLELTAVFVAAGVGMRLGWTILDPGPRPRAVAIAEEGRSAIVVALGLIVVLLVSGVIEAFVTPSPLPTWARIGIGVLAWAGFLAYVAVFGRRAERAGDIGDLVGDEATDVLPYAA